MIDIFSLYAADSVVQPVSMAIVDTGGHEPAGHLITTTGALVAAVILGYLLWKRRNGSPEPLQSGTTTGAGQISSILEQALLLRSRIDLSFHPISTSRQTISCTLFELTTQGVTLEMPVGVSPSEGWIGKAMVCYFRIPRENKPPFFYTFVSDVTAVRKQGEIHYLTLALPSKVELGQKRRYLRLELPSQDIKDFRIWPASEDGTFHFESDPANWPEPLAVYDPHSRDGVQVLDISGGGIKLSFNPERYSGLDDFVARHPVLFMRLELSPAGNMDFPPYFMAARLRTKAQDIDDGTLMLGYEFVECCATEGMETIDWIKIEPERGIDELVTWVFKRHLELYREREIV